MEHQFTILREQLYQERIRQNEMHLADVRNGRSQAYLEPLKDLTEVMQNRIEVAGILRRFRLENIEHKFLSEEQAARQHFEVKTIHFKPPFDLCVETYAITFVPYCTQSEKELAKDLIHEELMEKIRRLEEDRHNVDISWADWSTSTRTSKVRGPGRKKPITVTGPYIVYMLSEDQILDDWRLIRKGMKKASPSTSS